MKRMILSGAALLLSVGAALAADMPIVKAPPAPPPPPLWTGFFLGPSIAYDFGSFGNNNSGKDLFCITAFCPNPLVTSQFNVPGAGSNGGSFAGGGQLGYNWEFNPYFVFGAVGDVTVFNHSGDVSRTRTFGPIAGTTETDTHTDSYRHDWLGTIRLRAGPTFNDLWIYGTGGLAFGDLKSNSSSVTTWSNPGYVPPTQVVASGSGSTSGLAFGYAIGAGAEYKLLSNWSIFAEYLYYDLRKSYSVTVAGNPACPLICVPSASYDMTAKASGNIVKLGFNFSFQSR
jgi:outer membrane immunogenic protein